MAQKFLSKVTPFDALGTEDAVSFILGNGLKVVVKLGDLPEDVKHQLMVHGLSQKVGDASAGFSKAGDYSGAFGAMQSVADNLRNGIWASRTGSGTSDFVVALATLKDIEVDEAQALVDKMSEEQMAAVRKHPQVKLEMARIKEARLSAAVSDDTAGLDNLLEDIGLN